ncbi:uncharacterized protein LOC115958838 [Quercus lobata]|uniref:uncharacterized protein LOC115958838 n=1 Tax=Quercus lobata TaxID=97700 RepID=UPI0012445B98|nr:uncharacterized protein LOC115958838 [Quercus lobata]
MELNIAQVLEKIERFTQLVSGLLESGKTSFKELSNEFEERMIMIHKEQTERNGRKRSKTCGCSIPQMRRPMLFCKMLDTYYRVLRLIFDGFPRLPVKDRTHSFC